MTAADLAILKSQLEELSLAHLRSLDDALLPWLPPLRNSERRRAVSDIVRALKDVQPAGLRLRCLCWLHTWLIPRRSIRPWHAVRFRRASVIADFDRVLSRTASALRFHGCEVTRTWNLEDGTVFACLLTQNLESLTYDHDAYYLALWPGLPLVAIFAPERRALRRLQRSLLMAVEGAPLQKLVVPFGDLETVFHACLSHLSIRIEPGTLEVPTVRKPDPSSGPQTLDEESKRRLDRWNAALAELGSSLNPVDSSYTVTDGKGTWVRFEGPNLLEKLRSLYMRGFDAIISDRMLPAFLGKEHHTIISDDHSDSS